MSGGRQLPPFSCGWCRRHQRYYCPRRSVYINAVTANSTWYQSRYEQKYLLHNWSNCCHRNRPQIARPVLESWPFGMTARSEDWSLLVRMATLSVHCQFLKADSVSRTWSQLSVANECHRAFLTLLRLCRPCHPKYLCSERRYWETHHLCLTIQSQKRKNARNRLKISRLRQFRSKQLAP